ncbi:MAG: ribonuclease P protein subunit [Nitrosopumilus sp.]|nr:ribonuclease P protein subunit [Nitrosopumilus sp.]MDH3385048.1 ribonuclease P protein subunit [Nitrosopumilus sp.]
MITSGNIVRHEFIGLKTQILDSANQQIIGLNGTIIQETKSMFKLNTKKGIKLIPKARTMWKFSLNEQRLIVNGSKIQKRPFDRIGDKP